MDRWITTTAWIFCFRLLFCHMASTIHHQFNSFSHPCKWQQWLVQLHPVSRVWKHTIIFKVATCMISRFTESCQCRAVSWWPSQTLASVFQTKPTILGGSCKVWWVLIVHVRLGECTCYFHACGITTSNALIGRLGQGCSYNFYSSVPLHFYSSVVLHIAKSLYMAAMRCKQKYCEPGFTLAAEVWTV